MAECGTGRIVAIGRAMGRTSATDGGDSDTDKEYEEKFANDSAPPSNRDSNRASNFGFIGRGERLLDLLGADNTGADSRPITAVKSFLRVFETNDSGII